MRGIRGVRARGGLYRKSIDMNILRSGYDVDRRILHTDSGGAGEDLSAFCDVPSIRRTIASLQNADGSFRAYGGDSEHDMRFLYCACAIGRFLNCIDAIDADKAEDFITRSQVPPESTNSEDVFDTWMFHVVVQDFSLYLCSSLLLHVLYFLLVLLFCFSIFHSY